MHKRDTGEFPIFDSASDAGSDNSVNDELVGDGTLPSATLNWAFSDTGSIDTYLNINQLGLVTNNLRRGRVAYRGPYWDVINEDPWGNAYLLNAVNLEDSSANIAYVMSAGPAGAIDTDPQPG